MGRYMRDTSETLSAQFLPRLRVFAYCSAIDDERSTELTTVWFQGDLQPMPAPTIRTEIEQMDWYKFARECGPD